MARQFSVPARIRPVSLGLAASLALIAAGNLQAEDRAAVLENIRPVGQVNVQGAAAAAPAAPEAAPVAEAPAAPAAEPAAEVAAAEPVAEAAAAPAAVDGQQVYQMSCFACHGTGAAGAPKLGDKAAWEPRVAQGKATLLQHALGGFNAMPPKGGNMSLSDDQVSAAIDFMISNL